MNHSLIAKILPTKKNGKRIVGTGYPISNELVLTAYHVACFEDRDNSIPISIEWPDIKDAEGKVYKVEVTDQVLIKCTEEGDGIAILKCKVPDNEANSPLIITNFLPDRDKNNRWDSLGYPRFGKEGNLRDPEEAMGEFCLINPNKATIKLEAKIYPREKDDWGGMSGAPVFQGQHLYAVIIDTPSKVDMELRAISIPWLLEHKNDELSKLGSPVQENKEYVSFIEGQIMDYLKEIKGQPLYNSLSDRYKPESILSGLKSALVKDPIALLEDYRTLCEPIKKHAEEAHKLFVLLLGLISPRHQKREAKLHHIPVQTKMMTEIYLSARYNLPPSLKQGRDEIEGECVVDVNGLRETGWILESAADEITKAVDKAVNKVSQGDCDASGLNSFKRKKLNRTLLTRRKNNPAELIYIAIESVDKEADRDHPLHNNEVCNTLHSPGYLPDMPIARYGMGETVQEADLDAVVDEFFRIIPKA